LEFLAFVLEIESCNKILISGSCLEYNKAQGECKESDVCSPKDHFTWAKNSIYSWLSMRCAQKEVVLGWFRIFYVYGPGQRPGSLVPTILSSLRNNELPCLRTPRNANDYIFIDDVIDAFYAAIISKKISSGVYNLGSGISTTALDICRYAEQIILGTDLHTQQLEREAKNSTADINFWAGVDAAKKKLDWSPKIALESGIKRTWNDLNKL
jgi:nucleoside-diphosphate-sugar epimerase